VLQLTASNVLRQFPHVFSDLLEQGAAEAGSSEHPQVLAHRWLSDPELAGHFDLAQPMSLDEFFYQHRPYRREDILYHDFTGGLHGYHITLL
jgi:hypothetical protein